MSRLLLPFALFAVACVLPAQAGATLVFQRGVVKPVVWTAHDDGSAQRRLVSGSNPHISPDGTHVAYTVGTDHPVLRVIPTAGGAARTILPQLQYGPFAWSPDGSAIAAIAGPEIGRQRLTLIDVPTGAKRTLATGYFTGASFAPQSDRLVYDRSARQTTFPSTDLWIAPVDAHAGAPRRLTTDHHSLSPVWGPTQIAYTRYARPTGKYRKIDGPKDNLWLIAPDGSGARALTHDRIPYLLTGYTPTWWSADGTRLLAQFGGQDTTYAIAVDVTAATKHVIGQKTEIGITGTQLSADGSTVLGYSSGFDSDSPRNVLTVPWNNAAPTTVARRATQGSWGGS